MSPWSELILWEGSISCKDYIYIKFAGCQVPTSSQTRIKLRNKLISKIILLNLIPCEIRVSHGHIISSYLYILYIQIKHVEISNCQSFHHQSTTIFLKCISFRRGSSIGKKRKMCAFRNMFLCYVTITDMSLTVKNASSDVEFDISEYLYIYNVCISYLWNAS